MKNAKRLFQLSMVAAMMCYCYISVAQNAKPPKSPKATVSQQIGVDTEVTIEYARPGVKGRTIWGDLVLYGMNPGNKYSKDKEYPWRAGANQNTTIAVNKDILIEDVTKEPKLQLLPAGKYSIHMVPGESEFKIMFNKTVDAWGSFTYDAAQDALVVTVKPESSEHTEWLEFCFEDLADNGATAYLKWDNLKIPIKIQLVE